MREAFESRTIPNLNLKKNAKGDYVYPAAYTAWRDFQDGYLAGQASTPKPFSVTARMWCEKNGYWKDNIHRNVAEQAFIAGQQNVVALQEAMDTIEIGFMKSADEWVKIFIEDFSGMNLETNIPAITQFIRWVQEDVPVFSQHKQRIKKMNGIKRTNDIDYVEFAVDRIANTAKDDVEKLVGQVCRNAFDRIKSKLQLMNSNAMQWLGGDYDCLNKFCGLHWGRADAKDMPEFEDKENVVVWNQISEQWINCPVNHFIVRQNSGELTVYSPEAFGCR